MAAEPCQTCSCGSVTNLLYLWPAYASHHRSPRLPSCHPSTAALQLLLHSYVSRLPSDQYTTLRPLYRTGGLVRQWRGWAVILQMLGRR